MGDADSSASTTEDLAHQVESALASLKSIVSIVMALALTNTIVGLLAAPSSKGIAALSSIDEWHAVCSVAVIGAIVRFYHGNNRLVDRLYIPKGATRHAPEPQGLALDFLVIFTQSVMFAVLSFYAAPRRELLLLFGVLLLFDIIWYVATLRLPDPAEWRAYEEARNTQRKWMLNNLIFGSAVWVCYVGYLQHTGARAWIYVGAIAIVVNTLVDFYISADLYFWKKP